MTELERKALKLRRERLKKQQPLQDDNILQVSAQKFTSEWRKSITLKAILA